MPNDYSSRRPPHSDMPPTAHFVTARAAKATSPFVGAAGEVAVEGLLRTRDRYNFLLLAYVFMPDHAHFVIVPHESNSISQVMRYVKGAIARRINTMHAKSGAVWQESFYDEIPRDLEALNRMIEYVHHNPVRAGLVRAARDYPLSSADARAMADYQTFLGGSVAHPAGPSEKAARGESPR